MKKVKVHKITIDGNTVLSDKKLKRVMQKTNEKNKLVNLFRTKKFIEEKYEEDKQHIIDKYNELGYRDAQIVVDSISPYDDRTVDVYMKIEEGDKYYLRNVTWVGNTIYASDWLNEQLRMKKGEVIQLSVAPLLGIEVARLEISPERILAVDRLHKQYVEVSFEDLNRMANLNLSFNVLQSLFMNEIFLPGKETVEVYDLHRFRMTSEGNYALWKVKDTKKLAYSFRTTADKGWLENTSVALSGTPYALNWTYGEFCKLGAAYFPQHILAELMGSGKTYSLDMKLSRMSVGEDWETRTSLSSKYKKIELATLLKMWLER